MIAHALRTHRVRHSSALGEWEMVFGEPDPRLRPHLRGGYVGFVENALARQVVELEDVLGPTD